MPKAFIMLNTEMGKERIILEKLRKTPQVNKAHYVYGVYDLVVEVEADTMDALKQSIFKEIRNLEGVRSTLTMVALE